MNNRYRTLPPLGSLIGFEAAARLGSFSLAAEELNMTQSAVSHQIRTLETHLQQPLFLRINRRVDLTDAGRALQVTAETALETLRQGFLRLDAFSKPGSVVLHMPPDIGRLWMVPRMVRLQAAHPEVEPWLDTRDVAIDLFESEVDISLTAEPPTGPGVLTAPFSSEERVPLARPDLAADFGAAMQTAPLIHDECAEDWLSWFSKAGIARDTFVSGFNFTDPALALDAAMQGLGVCLGSQLLAEPLIAAGKLARVSAICLHTKPRLHWVTLKRNIQRPAANALWSWLQGEVAHMQNVAEP